MSDLIERLTDTVLACQINAPTPRAGARLAVYRVMDELRRELLGDDAIGRAGYAVQLGMVRKEFPDRLAKRAIATAFDAITGEQP